MICRFNYSWSALPIREKSKSKYVYFDLVNLPLPLLAERAGALLFLAGRCGAVRERDSAVRQSGVSDGPGIPPLRSQEQWSASG